jgi:hypothetical protein
MKLAYGQRSPNSASTSPALCSIGTRQLLRYSVIDEDVGRTAGVEVGRVLTGLPHPSPANVERIAFFLDRKAQRDLSHMTSPEVILNGRAEVSGRVQQQTTLAAGGPVAPWA